MNPLNITTQFILPMIYENNVKHEIINKSFINSYVSDCEIPKWDDKIIVIHSENEEPKNTKNTYVSKYKTNNHFAYVYDILEKDKKNYHLILNDNYNLLNSQYKNKLLYFWSQNDKETKDLLHFTLYKELYNNLSLKKIRELNLQLRKRSAMYPKFIPDKEIYWRK